MTSTPGAGSFAAFRYNQKHKLYQESASKLRLEKLANVFFGFVILHTVLNEYYIHLKA